jgi:hypothetical protein
MADSFMPDVEVHIAFNAGYTTPAASRTWTDVSQYVELHEGIDIDFGRQDERSTADANTLTLTLDNSDGRFTAGRSASPYYPDVKIGRPIRVRVTPPGGSTVTRFVGFVDEWPVEWEGADRYAKAKMKASSRLSRLGLSAKLRSMPEQAIAATQPVRWWTMGDPSGSTAATEVFGRESLPAISVGGYTTPVVFGSATGPATDGLTGVQFVGLDAPFGSLTGMVLYSMDAASALPAGPQSVRAWVRLDGLCAIDTLIVDLGNGIYLYVTPAGVVRTTVCTGPNIADGRGHDIVVTRNGTSEILYVDGVAVSTAARPMPNAGRYLSAGWYSGSMAHLAIYATALSAGDIATMSSSVLTGNSGERTDQRAVRLLDWASVPATEFTTDTGVETMAYQSTSGQSVVDALREVEVTEGGVLFDDRDGNVRLRNRSHRYLATPAATLNMSAQHVGADYSPKLDRSTLLNDVEVSNPTTEQKVRAVDTASSDEYGIATGSVTSLALTTDPLQQKANWLINSYAQPRTRVPSLTVDVLAHQGLTPSAQTLLGVTVGDLLAVTNAPMQADTTAPSYFVEGYTERIGPESYELSFNLSPAQPTLGTFVLDSATRGVLDTSILAY